MYERKRKREGVIASSWNLIYQILPNLFPEIHTHTVGWLVGIDTTIERKQRERERGSFTDIINDCAAAAGCM